MEYLLKIVVAFKERIRMWAGRLTFITNPIAILECSYFLKYYIYLLKVRDVL